MATTPPLQLRCEDPATPPTPLHGAAYDNLESFHRYSTRSSNRKVPRDLQSTPETVRTPRAIRSVATPGSSRRASQNSNSDLPHLHSPRHSPKHTKVNRRVQVISPSSPGLEPPIQKATTSSTSDRSLFVPSTSTMTEGMLPTPIKTPKKKTIPKINAAARALFQDQSVIGDEYSSPRRGRKAKRYNGFSLETFPADNNEGQGRIQIFTDSRDKVPQADNSESNPFVDGFQRGEPSAKKVAGTSKRRKISGEKKKDPQVEEAIKKNEGMVYVFRGKKVYRRFDDADEEEEVIDPTDLGLLEHARHGTAEIEPLRTLSRKSIKPTRLFQTEKQKAARELQKEEEAATDIEDESDTIPVDIPSPEPTTANSPAAPRSLRSAAKNPIILSDESTPPSIEKIQNAKPTRGSPFDKWPRMKAGSSSSAKTSTVSKSRKRGAAEALEEPETAEKKIKAT